jgi:hypothetical protein
MISTFSKTVDQFPTILFYDRQSEDTTIDQSNQTLAP